MPASTHQRHWLPDDLWALPDDGNRYECIGGTLLVTPSPEQPHQRVLARRFLAVASYATDQHLGLAYFSPADVRPAPQTAVQPDLFVVSAATAESARGDWRHVTSLMLAVAVLSPASAKYDRGLKRHFYQHARTDEYWIVDLEARLVERWLPDDERPEVLSEVLTWQPPGASDPLQIDLPVLFAGLPSLDARVTRDQNQRAARARQEGDASPSWHRGHRGTTTDSSVPFCCSVGSGGRTPSSGWRLRNPSRPSNFVVEVPYSSASSFFSFSASAITLAAASCGISS